MDSMHRLIRGHVIQVHLSALLYTISRVRQFGFSTHLRGLA